MTPKQQKTAWKTTSTASPRLLEAHARLDRQMRRLFPGVEPTFDYNMRGWKVLRRRQVTEWKGTMDPNWVRIYIAERKQGVTVHAWDPFDPTSLQKHAPRLAKAGFKAMVGCLQYNRTGPVPVEALGPLLESMAKAWKAERAG